jgi:hypothetical protein
LFSNQDFTFSVMISTVTQTELTSVIRNIKFTKKSRKIAHDDRFRVTSSMSALNSISSLDFNLFQVPEFKSSWGSQFSIYKAIQGQFSRSWVGIFHLNYFFHCRDNVERLASDHSSQTEVVWGWFHIVWAPEFLCGIWNIAVILASFLQNC